jgi:hypothetical protein
MYYALMCHARHRHGCTRFDFGRSKIGSGAAEFKHNFGFTAEPLCYFHRPLRAQARRDINPNSAKYRSFTKVWRKLPLPIANLIGPFIARGLG